MHIATKNNIALTDITPARGNNVMGNWFWDTKAHKIYKNPKF